MTRNILLTDDEIKLIIKCLEDGKEQGLVQDDELRNDLRMVLADTL